MDVVEAILGNSKADRSIRNMRGNTAADVAVSPDIKGALTTNS